MRLRKFSVSKKGQIQAQTFVLELSTYRPHTVEDNNCLFGHGCQGVWFFYICHDDVHLCPQLWLTCRHTQC